MSLDPFEARLQFLGLLRKLSASQQSIQTVVSYALKYGRKCGEDLWDCIVEECGKGSLNTRINILYFLDTLCDPQTTSTLIPTASSSTTTDFPYTALLNRDVEKLVGLVVPESKEGILNLLSAKQIVESFRNKRTIPGDVCDELVEKLEKRRTAPMLAPDPASVTNTPNAKKRPHPSSLTNFSRNDTLRRMEEDRERHKRLREGMWVLPIPGVGSVVPLNSNGHDRPAAGGVSKLRAGAGLAPGSTTGAASAPSNSVASSTVTSPASPSETGRTRSSEEKRTEGPILAEHIVVDPIDVEFEQIWESLSDFGDEDRDNIMQENQILARTRAREVAAPHRRPGIAMDFDVGVQRVS